MTNLNLSCLKIEEWRLATANEIFPEIKRTNPKKAASVKRGSILAFRKEFRPVDMYCYLRARFGEPNGVQNLLRRDDSDNLVHWHFTLMAEQAKIHILGQSREVHVMISEPLEDRDWAEFARAVKLDFARVGAAKKQFQDTLQKWVVFPNKYSSIADVCAMLHAEVTDAIDQYTEYKPIKWSKMGIKKNERALKNLAKRAVSLFPNCIQLSLLTPVMAEAHINLLILALCKPEIRKNPRQYDAYRREHIDAKIFDLPFKCDGFEKTINPKSEGYKRFKRVMDGRNDAIHANIDPIGEQIETVFFEGTRPIFHESGDQITQFWSAMERLHQPAKAVESYEAVHNFLWEVEEALEPPVKKAIRALLSNGFPGYDLNRNICGVLFGDRLVSAHMKGVAYDDELGIDW